MEDRRLGVVETQFADIIWNNEPIPSGRLVQLCNAQLGWKKSTTYTVLRKLCEQGLFQNEGGAVTSKISKEDFTAMQGEKFLEETYEGSLPAFIAAFAARKRLSAADIADIQKMIDDYKEG